jgi:hypothetical protein
MLVTLPTSLLLAGGTQLQTEHASSRRALSVTPTPLATLVRVAVASAAPWESVRPAARAKDHVAHAQRAQRRTTFAQPKVCVLFARLGPLSVRRCT